MTFTISKQRVDHSRIGAGCPPQSGSRIQELGGGGTSRQSIADAPRSKKRRPLVFTAESAEIPIVFGSSSRGGGKLSGPSLIYDPNAGGEVEANLNFEADGLTVFGPTGRRLQHWRYDEIRHAFPKVQGKNEYLIHPGRPELRLQVRDGGVYDAIVARAPQLRRRPFISWQAAWESLPEEFHAVLFLLLFGSSATGLYLLIHLFD